MEDMAEYYILQEIIPPQWQIQLRIGIDNQSAYIMVTPPTYSRQTSHIEIRWNHVRERVQKVLLIGTRSKVKTIQLACLPRLLTRCVFATWCTCLEWVTTCDRIVLFEWGVFGNVSDIKLRRGYIRSLYGKRTGSYMTSGLVRTKFGKGEHR